MNKSLVVSLVTLSLAAPALADVTAPPKVELALKRALPSCKWTVEDGPRAVNGVGVYDVEVANKFGRTAVSITEDGNFLVSPVPSNPNKLPGPVKNVIDHVFKNAPGEVVRYEETVFVVGINAGGQDSDVVFDPVGRIVGLHSAADLRVTEKEFGSEGELHDPEIHKTMKALMDRMQDKGKIDSIYRDPDNEGFYVVSITNDQGKNVQYVTNGNEVFARKVTMDESELPAAVRDAIHGDLNADSITGIVRRRYEYFQFDVTAASGDVVTLQIDSDGKVLSVNSKGAEAQAEEAKKNAHR